MRAALLRLAAFAAIVWFQFAVYPGHSYVQGASQIFVPQFEHLDSPGFLTRDLVATHTNLTFTVFDETSLLLHRTAHMPWESVLAAQQIASRAAGLSGIILLAGAAGLSGWWPLLVAAGAGFVGELPAIGASPFGLEPTPYSIAFGFVLLAAGLLATEKPLLAGCLGGLALVYDPRIAAPFWVIALLMLIFDRSLRRLVRAMLPLLAVFALLLANFAQLQPTTDETHSVFTRLPPVVEAIQRLRTPGLWITAWEGRDLLFYTALSLLVLWALIYQWRTLPSALRWLLLGLPVAGVVSVPLSIILLGGLHLRFIPLLDPATTLLFTALPGAVACVVAARKSGTKDRWLFLAGPVLLLVASWTPIRAARTDLHIESLATWARQSTWGASMFLFPDAGRGLAPGAFRARSLRPVWVDWETGSLCDSSDAFALDWQQRWQITMAGPYSPNRLRGFLRLPIDYIVLAPEHAIPGVTPVFGDSHWLVYDSANLRSAGGR